MLTRVEEAKLNKLIAKSYSVCRQFNIKVSNDTTFSTMKSISMWGHCRYKADEHKYYIRINEKLVKGGDDVSIMNTIIHELLHTNCMKHTGRWKQYANLITENSIYTIQRCTSESEKGMKISNKIKTKRISPKFKVTCQTCNKDYYYTRRCSVVTQILNGSTECTCPYCKGNKFDVLMLR